MPENKKRPGARTSPKPPSAPRPKQPLSDSEKPVPPTKAKSKPRTVRAAPRTRSLARSVGSSNEPAALSIFMVTSEAHPYAKTGGLAEVAAALPDALGRLGHDVTLVLPRYRGVDVTGSSPQSAIVPLGSARQPVTFHRREERTGVTAVFVDVPELFDREGLYNVN